MKTTKIIILFTAMSLFTLASYNTADARDCSNPKGFHQKMMCKVIGERDLIKSDNSVAADKPLKKGKYFDKLKKFLGKKE